MLIKTLVMVMSLVLGGVVLAKGKEKAKKDTKPKWCCMVGGEVAMDEKKKPICVKTEDANGPSLESVSKKAKDSYAKCTAMNGAFEVSKAKEKTK